MPGITCCESPATGTMEPRNSESGICAGVQNRGAEFRERKFDRIRKMDRFLRQDLPCETHAALGATP
jgi:hypothetical protein